MESVTCVPINLREGCMPIQLKDNNFTSKLKRILGRRYLYNQSFKLTPRLESEFNGSQHSNDIYNQAENFGIKLPRSGKNELFSYVINEHKINNNYYFVDFRKILIPFTMSDLRHGISFGFVIIIEI